MKIKAGYKTSEFWFTLVSFIFSGLYLTGLLKENDQKEELITIVSHAVESVILISGQVLIFYRYIKGRTEVKKIAVEQTQPQPQEEIVDDNKRTNTRPSRKSKSKTKRVPKKSKKSSTK